MINRWQKQPHELEELGFKIKPTKEYNWFEAPIAQYELKTEMHLKQFIYFMKKFASCGDHIILNNKIADIKINQRRTVYDHLISHFNLCSENIHVWKKPSEEISDKVDYLYENHYRPKLIHIPTLLTEFNVDDYAAIKELQNNDYATIKLRPVFRKTA